MATLQMADTTEICEETLRTNRAYNIEHQIWPSENVVIDRLLARRVELIDAYTVIHERLHDRPHGINTILSVLVNVTALWNPIAAYERH
jgi:hypothetical protein